MVKRFSGFSDDQMSEWGRDALSVIFTVERLLVPDRERCEKTKNIQ